MAHFARRVVDAGLVPGMAVAVTGTTGSFTHPDLFVDPEVWLGVPGLCRWGKFFNADIATADGEEEILHRKLACQTFLRVAPGPSGPLPHAPASSNGWAMKREPKLS